METSRRRRGDDDDGEGSKGRTNEAIVVLVAGVEDVSVVPESLRQCFTHEIEAKPPTEAERLATLRACLRVPDRPTLPADAPDGSESFDAAGFTDADLVAAAAATSGAMARDSARSPRTPPLASDPERPVTSADVRAATEWSERRAAAAVDARGADDAVGRRRRVGRRQGGDTRRRGASTTSG